MLVQTPDPKEVERALALTFWCSWHQAYISREQCKVNLQRARKMDTNNEAYMMPAYSKCLDCKKSKPNKAPAAPPPQDDRIKCNRCGRKLSLDQFEHNPKTNLPMRRCAKCRRDTRRVASAQPKPRLTIASDGRTVIFGGPAVREFDMLKWSLIRFKCDMLQIELCERPSKNTYRLTRKGEADHKPTLCVACTKAIQEMDVTAGQRYLLQWADDGIIQMCVEGKKEN